MMTSGTVFWIASGGQWQCVFNKYVIKKKVTCENINGLIINILYEVGDFRTLTGNL